MLLRRMATLACGFAALLVVGLGAVPAQAATDTARTKGREAVAQTARVGENCNLYSLTPNKHVSSTVYVESDATAVCNYRPQVCTYHVQLQQFESYYRSWVTMTDQWYYSCPTFVNSAKQMYALYRCPAGSAGVYRTVLTAHTEPAGNQNNQVISGSARISG